MPERLRQAWAEPGGAERSAQGYVRDVDKCQGHAGLGHWAQLNGGRLTQIADPGGSAPVQYGLDAVRLPLWLDTSCPAGARHLVAQWWSNVLSHGERTSDLTLSTSGTAINQDTNPVPLLAGAAARSRGLSYRLARA
jgi:hypothetical protein